MSVISYLVRDSSQLPNFIVVPALIVLINKGFVKSNCFTFVNLSIDSIYSIHSGMFKRLKERCVIFLCKHTFHVLVTFERFITFLFVKLTYWSNF